MRIKLYNEKLLEMYEWLLGLGMDESEAFDLAKASARRTVEWAERQQLAA